ncbi:MAG: decaprenyl-phosphate phosphoribosyltransferase [Armatimonadetes bacterium]|nr:decaprenyl-phosphate phosphoribosyltransferase [Armatimonadota bacterium]
MLSELGQLFIALRPRQWLKNGLVLAALVFARRWTDPRAVEDAALAFVAFCCLASFTYLLNDLRDVEEDRRHPHKRHRPLASGKLRVSTAAVGAMVLLGVGLGLAFAVNMSTGLVAGAYVGVTVLYQLGLKEIVIIDVLAIATGFVLRAVAGATAISAEISPWLLICTVQLALFLALGKRRQEIVLLGEEAANHRAALGQYSIYLLDQMIAVVTASTVMSYALYTISERTVHIVGSTNMMYTIPFVLYGIFRYLYLMHSVGEGGAPDKVLLTDKPLLINVLLYVVASVIILHFGHPESAPQPPLPI